MKPQTISAINDIVETLQGTDNEGTESPYWVLIDPAPIRDSVTTYVNEDTGKKYSFDGDDAEHVAGLLRRLTGCFTGPFFSRQDAEAYLSARSYEYSTEAYVYCFSGYWSQKYKSFCRSLELGRKQSGNG